VDISRNFILIKFGKIFRLAKLSGLFRCKVDISRNFRLINFGGFSRF